MYTTCITKFIYFHLLSFILQNSKAQEKRTYKINLNKEINCDLFLLLKSNLNVHVNVLIFFFYRSVVREFNKELYYVTCTCWMQTISATLLLSVFNGKHFNCYIYYI